MYIAYSVINSTNRLVDAIFNESRVVKHLWTCLTIEGHKCLSCTRYKNIISTGFDASNVYGSGHKIIFLKNENMYSDHTKSLYWFNSKVALVSATWALEIKEASSSTKIIKVLYLA